MKKTNNIRIKIALPNIATREDAESVMNALALTITNQRATIAKRDAEVLAVNKQYEANLAAYDQDIQIKTESLRAWAEANPSQFPKDRKSLALTSGTIGFRTGTPKLALLSRAFNWDKVLENVRAFLPQFVRTKDEVDKENIIAHRQTLNLAELGLKITQDETFFAEPQLTQLETRQTVDTTS